MKKFIKFINTLLILICIAGAAFFGFKILQKQKEYRESEQSFQKIDNIYNSTESKSNKFAELKKRNNDFRGWITVEGTNISYPVTQAKDNKYYLKHNFFKEYNPAGTVFMDYENQEFNDKNTIIYAHYMKNKTLFHNLQLFKKKEFFDKNKKITIETENAIYEYEIFSIHVPSSSFNYLTTNFLEKDYQEFLNEIQWRSIFKSDTKVTTEDRILTLSTCSYEFKNARTVVHAVLKNETFK